jgi:hypothetical protein
MRTLSNILFALVFAFGNAVAGDDASGPIKYSVNLGAQFQTYQLTDKDKEWSRSLAQKFNYSGRIVHFVRTSLPLTVTGQEVKGAVYQAVEKPEYFYVRQGDAMLKVNTEWPYSPGVGGFSMHAPSSVNFIVCLNFQPGGVPFLSSSRVIKDVVSWGGHERNRI